jgi:exopolysaccharide production protein ExoQ
VTALDFDRLYAPSSAGSILKKLLPIASAFFVGLMFILASNNTKAMERWQEVAGTRVFELQTEVQEGRTIRQISILCLGAWGAVCAIYGKRRLNYNYAFVFPLAVFAALAVGSVVWSHERSFTAKRLIVFVCIASAIVGFIRMFRFRDLATFAFVGCALQISICVLFELIYDVNIEGAKGGYRFSGTLHPNHSGIYSVVLLLASVCLFDRTGRRAFLAVALLALWVLVLTKSRSSLIAGVMALATYAALRISPARLFSVVGVGLVGVALLLIGIASGLMPDDFTHIITMGREDASESKLTGRDMIWSAAFSVPDFEWSRLVTGFGYESFWTASHARFVSDTVRFQISESHNAYLDLMLELGLVGALCYIFMVFGGLFGWARMAWIRKNAAFAFCAAIVAFSVVHGLTESTTTDPTYIAFFTLCSVSLLAFRSPTRDEPPGEELP